VAALKQLNASISYDYSYSNGVFKVDGKPWAPEWLRRFVGDEYFQEVTAVNFLQSDAKLKDADLVCLGDLDRLESLNLMQLSSIRGATENTNLTDSCLDYLARLPRLRILGLNRTGITDAGLAKIARMNGIEELNLRDTNVTVSGLAALKPLKSLHKLNLNVSTCTDAGLAQVAGLSHLQSLSISGTSVRQIPDPSGELLSLFNLQHLDSSPITDTGWELLQKLPELTELNFFRVPISDRNLNQFQKLLHLRKLTISRGSIPPDDSQITDIGLASIAAMPELETLWLDNQGLQPAAGITAVGVARLKNLKNLRVLHLEGEEYTDAGVAFLKDLTELRELNLESNNITDATLVQLEGLSHLEELHLYGCEITDASLASLRKLTNLKILTLMSTRVSYTGFSTLKAALPSLRYSDCSASRPPVVSDPEQNGEKGDDGKPPAPPTSGLL
jgi:Leucine-rich repeat (LRR) protein